MTSLYMLNLPFSQRQIIPPQILSPLPNVPVYSSSILSFCFPPSLNQLRQILENLTSSVSIDEILFPLIF